MMTEVGEIENVENEDDKDIYLLEDILQALWVLMELKEVIGDLTRCQLIEPDDAVTDDLSGSMLSVCPAIFFLNCKYCAFLLKVGY